MFRSGRARVRVAFVGLAVVLWPAPVDSIAPPTSAEDATSTEGATSAEDATSADGATTAGSDTEPSPTVTLLVTGEMLIHPRVSHAAARYATAEGQRYDFTPMFDLVGPLIREADLAVCHLEVQLGVPGVEVAGFPRMAAPAEFAGALADAGFDGCSTASNHANDQGNRGLLSTIEALDGAGVAHTGTAAFPWLAGGILYELPELTVGHASYTFAIQAHRRLHEWSINKIDADTILRDAAALRARGADFVMISLHWGREFRHAPTRAQRTLAEQLTASSNVDAIVGHHAHVLQPVEMMNGKPVLFGLGNFLSNQAPDCCGDESGDGAAVLLRLAATGSRWVVDDMEYVPTWVHRRGGGYVIWPTQSAREGEGPWRARRASALRATEALTFDGKPQLGLTVAEGLGWLRVGETVPIAWIRASNRLVQPR